MRLGTLQEHYGKPVARIEGEARARDSHSEGQVRIVFDDGSMLIGEPVGECCAHAYIDEIAGEISPGLHPKLVRIEQVAYTSQSADSDHQLDTFVEVIQTDDSDVAVLCRCRHNGYYSGGIEWTFRPAEAVSS